jgi:N-acetylglutamate synthase-like GNAT family acetyltransferase
MDKPSKEQGSPMAGDGGAVTIGPTDDLDAMQALAVANGLDTTPLPPDCTIAAWAAHTPTGVLAGGIALEYGGALDVIHWLAVEQAYRGRGVATRLLDALEVDARRRGVSRLWTAARAPGFFLANGFSPVDEGAEAALLLADCPSCPQYGRECTPRAMVKYLR